MDLDPVVIIASDPATIVYILTYAVGCVKLKVPYVKKNLLKLRLSCYFSPKLNYLLRKWYNIAVVKELSYETNKKVSQAVNQRRT